MKENIKECIRYIRGLTDFVPKVALILGSGLGNYGESIRVEVEIPYSDLPDFPVSTAPGHVGRFLMGYVDDVPVICMQGRLHYYEGYTMEQVQMPVRVMRGLGAEILFLSNAAGGIRPSFHPGDLVVIYDHISLFGVNPLIGPNDPEDGVRFPDMTKVYDRELCAILAKAAMQHDIYLQSGIYMQLTGPSFETPAEIRLCRALGADLVGMSTVPEAIVGRYLGMRVCAISLVSNLAAGISPAPLSSEEVEEAGREAAPLFTDVVTTAITMMKDL